MRRSGSTRVSSGSFLLMKSATMCLQRSTSSVVRWSRFGAFPPFSRAISALRSETSRFNRCMMTPGSTVSLRFISFCTSYTDRANRQVPRDSSRSSFEALIVAIIFVRQFPPSESLKIMVIIELRKGTWTSSPLLFLLRFWMTIYSIKRLELMFFVSWICTLSSWPVLLRRSEPERSTRCILLLRFTSPPILLDSISITNMQWLRVDASFLGVSDTTRFVSPINKRLRASSSFSALWTLRFCKLN